MDELIAILGKSIDSPEAREAFADFELTNWETDEQETGDDDDSLVDTAQGLEVQHNKQGVIQTIFLYSHGHQGFARFSQPLSRGLSFASNREDVLQAMGEPSHSGAPNPRGLLGPTGPWDRFDLREGVLHFQFRADRDSIGLVTLMTLDSAPEL